MNQNVSVHCTGIVYYFILYKNDTKYCSVILLQQDLHGNTVTRLFNIYPYFVITVSDTVIIYLSFKII